MYILEYIFNVYYSEIYAFTKYLRRFFDVSNIFEKKKRNSLSLLSHLSAFIFSHCILPRLPRRAYLRSTLAHHHMRTTRGDDCDGRNRTMCPRAVRSTEWILQTRNIIASTAHRQLRRYTTLFLSIPFQRGGGVSVPHNSPLCVHSATHTHATLDIRGSPSTLAGEREKE